MDKIRKLFLAAALSALFCTGAASAEIGLEVEVGAGHTDNIDRAVDDSGSPANDEIIYTAGLVLTLEHQSAKSDADVRGSVFWHDYDEDSYESETLLALDATAIFRITDQALSWFAQANIGQQTVDPFQPVTPENREDFTYLTTGPSLTIDLNPRLSFRTNAWLSDVGYEIQPFDNKRVGAEVSVVRRINPTRALSVNYRIEEIEFDNGAALPQIDREDLFLAFATEGARNELSLEVGVSRYERLNLEEEEPIATIEWRRQLSPASSLTISGGTRVSDAAESFRDVQRGSIEIGDVQIQQEIPSPFRENFADLALGTSASRTSVLIGARWSEQLYSELLAQQDRETLGAYARVGRPLGSAWRIGFTGMWDKRDYNALDRTDDEYSAGFELVWQRLRTIEVELRFDRFERNSTESDTEFRENRTYLGIRYIPIGMD